MVLPRDTIQRLLLRELESRGTLLESPVTQLSPPDKVILSGRGAEGPVRIELRAFQSSDGRWLVGVTGFPGVQGEARLDPSARLPAGHTVKRATIETERIIIELGG